MQTCASGHRARSAPEDEGRDMEGGGHAGDPLAYTSGGYSPLAGDGRRIGLLPQALRMRRRAIAKWLGANLMIPTKRRPSSAAAP
jgi:hypothetical protein